MFAAWSRRFRSSVRIVWLFLGFLYLQGGGIHVKAVEFAGGLGEPNAPYQIATAEQLIVMGSDPNYFDKHFVLVNDVNLHPDTPGGKLFETAVIASDGLTPFNGSLRGDGHILYGLTLAGGSEDMGLFGFLGRQGQVCDLGLRGLKITDISDVRSIGGLAGYNEGQITRCYVIGATDAMTGDKEYLGGIVGINEGRISACYTDVSIHINHRENHAGGLCGANRSGRIERCYAIGMIERGDWAPHYIEDAHVGGFAGSNTGDITASLWDLETSNQAFSDGAIGFETAQMQDAQTYALNGWSQDPNWVIRDGQDYPRLVWEGLGGGEIPQPTLPDWVGTGTSDEPISITSPTQLQWLGTASILWDRHFVVDADLDLSIVDLRPLGVGKGMGFRGVLDGQGHTLRGLTMSSSPLRYRKGLFGYIEESGLAQNLSLEKAYVGSGDDSAVLGLLAGFNAGRIQNCKVNGSLTAKELSSDIGGIVGINSGTILLSSSDVGVLVLHTSNIGGIAGMNTGTILSCSVTGITEVNPSTSSRSDFSHYSGSILGGVAGCNRDGTISHCINYGSVIGIGITGGICGENTGTLHACYNHADVFSGFEEVGGVVGRNSLGTITACAAFGTGTARIFSGPAGTRTGGLAGVNTGIIDTSYAAVDILGKSGGGLVAYNNLGLIMDSMTQSRVLGSRPLGGLVGEHTGIVINTLAAGSFLTQIQPEDTGGLIGYNKGSVKQSYFLLPDYGNETGNSVGIPLTTDQAGVPETFEGWDFYGNTTDGNEDKWVMPDGGPPLPSWLGPFPSLVPIPHVTGLPLEATKAVLEDAGLQLGQVLKDHHSTLPDGLVIHSLPVFHAEPGAMVDIVISQGPSPWDGSTEYGSADDPHRIGTAGDLEALARHPELWGQHVVLTQDIHMAGRPLSRALLAYDVDDVQEAFQGTPFTGVFDGQDFIIWNLEIMGEGNDYLGFIGCLGSEGVVRNVKLKNGRVLGAVEAAHVGLMVGFNEGALMQCYGQGLVRGGPGTGKLVGTNLGKLEVCSDAILVQNLSSGSGGRSR